MTTQNYIEIDGIRINAKAIQVAADYPSEAALSKELERIEGQRAEIQQDLDVSKALTEALLKPAEPTVLISRNQLLKLRESLLATAAMIDSMCEEEDSIEPDQSSPKSVLVEILKTKQHELDLETDLETDRLTTSLQARETDAPVFSPGD